MSRTLEYPRRNRIGVEPQWQRRRLQFIRRTDLLEEPMPLSDYLAKPLVRRGRFLWHCWDHDARSYRRFYECAFKHCFREPDIRIGQLVNGVLRPISEPYAATVNDRRLLAMILGKIRNRDDLRIYCDDLKVVAA